MLFYYILLYIYIIYKKSKQKRAERRSHRLRHRPGRPSLGHRRAHLLTLQRRQRPDHGDNILPWQWRPSQRSGRGLSGGEQPRFSHRCQTATQPCGEMGLLVCLKAQPVSGAEGLAFHSLHIVLQATMGCMGARPFVISSVVNFCWGNKGVTHLWLWIRSFFLSLFLCWDIAHGSPGHIKQDLWGEDGRHLR